MKFKMKRRYYLYIKKIYETYLIDKNKSLYVKKYKFIYAMFLDIQKCKNKK